MKEHFKELNEDNAVPSEPEKRARQDQLGPNWKTGMEFTPPPDGPGMRGEHGDFKDRTGAGSSAISLPVSLAGTAAGAARRGRGGGSDIEAEVGLQLEGAQLGD